MNRSVVQLVNQAVNQSVNRVWFASAVSSVQNGQVEGTKCRAKEDDRLALKCDSLRKIGNIVNKSHSTIQYVVNKFEYCGFTANQKRNSKEKILKEREERFIIRQIKSNPRSSVPKARYLMTKTTRKTVSETTVRRVLYKYRFHGRRIRKRPFVSIKNRALRIKFAKVHVNKEQEFWDSDETKNNIFGSDGAHRVWRKENEADKEDNNLPTVKHGGGAIMIWGCKSSKGCDYYCLTPSHFVNYVSLHYKYRYTVDDGGGKSGMLVTTLCCVYKPYIRRKRRRPQLQRFDVALSSRSKSSDSPANDSPTRFKESSIRYCSSTVCKQRETARFGWTFYNRDMFDIDSRYDSEMNDLLTQINKQ
ncbi:hypothetical protein ANN_20984 [Periplaneta americana]|uniref:Transposase Tc1-like domain-containing protein n=1 Tax=Periplaneta americana TaxID=6978 RepID=A0ABQ8SEW8_PERAM|nr:hypothetical protein ANN_20984 [Periplaneta americana]